MASAPAHFICISIYNNCIEKYFILGISYLTQPEEQKLREHLEEKHKSHNNTISSSPGNEETFQPIPIPDEYVSTIEDTW
jgi:hypothetical protein